MPFKPARPCAEPGCPHLTTDTTGRCDQHRPAYLKGLDERRGSAAERGYDWHWSQIRRQHLVSHPLCARCLANSVTRAAVVVHHLDRDPTNNLEENLMSVCHDCHEQLHQGHRFGRG
jgi:5-methylcytosine-specific restriction protein A